MTHKKPKSGIEQVKSLHEFICEDDFHDVNAMSEDEISSYLKKNHIYAETIIGAVDAQINKMKAKARLDEAKAKREQLIRRFDNFVTPEHIKENVKSLIDKLMTSNPELASAYFRKYESSTESDLKSLYEDLMQLEELAKDDAEK